MKSSIEIPLLGWSEFSAGIKFQTKVEVGCSHAGKERSANTTRRRNQKQRNRC